MIPIEGKGVGKEETGGTNKQISHPRNSYVPVRKCHLVEFLSRLTRGSQPFSDSDQPFRIPFPELSY